MHLNNFSCCSASCPPAGGRDHQAAMVDSYPNAINIGHPSPLPLSLPPQGVTSVPRPPLEKHTVASLARVTDRRPAALSPRRATQSRFYDVVELVAISSQHPTDTDASDAPAEVLQAPQPPPQTQKPAWRAVARAARAQERVKPSSNQTLHPSGIVGAVFDELVERCATCLGAALDLELLRDAEWGAALRSAATGMASALRDALPTPAGSTHLPGRIAATRQLIEDQSARFHSRVPLSFRRFVHDQAAETTALLSHVLALMVRCALEMGRTVGGSDDTGAAAGAVGATRLAEVLFAEALNTGGGGGGGIGGAAAEGGRSAASSPAGEVEAEATGEAGGSGAFNEQEGGDAQAATAVAGQGTEAEAETAAPDASPDGDQAAGDNAATDGDGTAADGNATATADAAARGVSPGAAAGRRSPGGAGRGGGSGAGSPKPTSPKPTSPKLSPTRGSSRLDVGTDGSGGGGGGGAAGGGSRSQTPSRRGGSPGPNRRSPPPEGTSDAELPLNKSEVRRLAALARACVGVAAAESIGMLASQANAAAEVAARGGGATLHVLVRSSLLPGHAAGVGVGVGVGGGGGGGGGGSLRPCLLPLLPSGEVGTPLPIEGGATATDEARASG